MRRTLAGGVTSACKLLYQKHDNTLLTTSRRNNKSFIKANGKRKAFFKGGNSTCQYHVHQHYEVYSEKCKAADIPVNHWAIPRPIWKRMEEEKDADKQGQTTKKKAQQQLKFDTVLGPREFTRSATLQAVAKLIATNNQVRC